MDEDIDKRKHSLKCNVCGNLRPIELKTWKLRGKENTFSNSKKYSDYCECQVLDDDPAIEQDVLIYKYLWNKVTKLRSLDKVRNQDTFL